MISDLLSKILCYHNDNFFVVWKPNMLPTTFGNEACFLDIFLGTYAPNLDFSLPNFLLPYIDLPDFVPCKLTQSLVDHQLDVFGKEGELGLLNRLDNETAGFLYFAKNQDAFDQYKQLQTQEKIHKWYIAQVMGTPKESAFEITIPIMHHKYKEDRMIFVRNPKDQLKGRSKLHYPSTIVKVLHTDPQTQVTTLLISISKGVRHQIRVHLSGIGYPIIGDKIYGKQDTQNNLALWSVGFSIHP